MINKAWIYLLIISAFYLAATAYLGYAAMEKLKTTDIGESQRIHRYKFSIAWNGMAAIFVFAVIFFSDISLYNIGLKKITISSYGDKTFKLIIILTLTICSLLTVIFICQIVAFIISKKYQAAMKAQMDSKAASGSLYDKTVNNLIPRTKKEKSWFFVTSLAAGACEEIVFRGFLLFLLVCVFPVTSLYFLVIIIGVLFGLSHFYQGVQGVCKTAAIGILFGFLYICTASLYPCILLHFLFDVSSIFLYPSTAFKAQI